jgi:ABC-type transport system, involved in lipoprotein release, permease component
MIWEIAWKNIWRNRTRSLVIILAMTVGMFGGIFASSLLRGMFGQRIENALNLELPHIEISKKSFTQNNDILLQINNADEQVSQIEQIAGIKTVSKRICVTSMISTPHNSLGITAYGVDPEKERDIFDLHKTIPDSLGGFLSTEKSNTIVMSQKLAEKLKIRWKSKSVLTLQSADEELVGGAFKVEGLYKTNNSAMDESTVFLNKQDLADLVGINENSCHQIIIRLTEEGNVQEIKDKIVAIVGGDYDVRMWSEIRPDVGMMIDLMEMMSTLILGIILIALGFSIANTMFMVVLERTKELGMLMAIGMSKTRVFIMVLLETLMLTLLGAVIGIVLSNLVITYFSKAGLNLQGADYSKLGMDTLIYPTLTLSDYGTIGFLVFLTGLLAAIFPACKALKVNPAEVVRN